MSLTDLALYTVGAIGGAVVMSGVLVWLWLRSCEKMSERGFGGG